MSPSLPLHFSGLSATYYDFFIGCLLLARCASRGRRTHKDPFEGKWEQIISWLVAHPERSSGDIFRELQRRSPGRYQPLQIRTLQRGMRKIRAHLLETLEEHWQEEVIQGQSLSPVSAEGPPAYPDRCQLSNPPG